MWILHNILWNRYSLMIQLVVVVTLKYLYRIPSPYWLLLLVVIESDRICLCSLLRFSKHTNALTHSNSFILRIHIVLFNNNNNNSESFQSISFTHTQTRYLFNRSSICLLFVVCQTNCWGTPSTQFCTVLHKVCIKNKSQRKRENKV